MKHSKNINLPAIFLMHQLLCIIVYILDLGSTKPAGELVGVIAKYIPSVITLPSITPSPESGSLLLAISWFFTPFLLIYILIKRNFVIIDPSRKLPMMWFYWFIFFTSLPIVYALSREVTFEVKYRAGLLGDFIIPIFKNYDFSFGLFIFFFILIITLLLLFAVGFPIYVYNRFYAFKE